MGEVVYDDIIHAIGRPSPYHIEVQIIHQHKTGNMHQQAVYILPSFPRDEPRPTLGQTD